MIVISLFGSFFILYASVIILYCHSSAISKSGCLGGAHQGHGDDILVPEGQEVEQDDGDDGGLCHGEDDATCHRCTEVTFYL